jgi:hypothetical protein
MHEADVADLTELARSTLLTHLRSLSLENVVYSTMWRYFKPSLTLARLGRASIGRSLPSSRTSTFRVPHSCRFLDELTSTNRVLNLVA